MGTPLTLHDVAESVHPIGIECVSCVRRAVLTAADLKAERGDSRMLTAAGLERLRGPVGPPFLTVGRKRSLAARAKREEAAGNACPDAASCERPE